jgi:hypothetical protein
MVVSTKQLCCEVSCLTIHSNRAWLEHIAAVLDQLRPATHLYDFHVLSSVGIDSMFLHDALVWTNDGLAEAFAPPDANFVRLLDGPQRKIISRP